MAHLMSDIGQSLATTIRDTDISVVRLCRTPLHTILIREYIKLRYLSEAWQTDPELKKLSLTDLGTSWLAKSEAQ